MVRTRSASSSPVKKQQPAPTKSIATTTTASKISSRSTAEPLKLVIAPRNLSTGTRFIDLRNPIDGKPQKFLFCPQHGLLELKKVESPKHDSRSTLFAAEKDAVRRADGISGGYINRIAAYSTASPFDICFLLLPLVTATGKSNLFQSLDDILDTTELDLYDLKYVLRNARHLCVIGLESICDTIEAGDEQMYRYNQTKVMKHILAKARRASEKGLPTSLEERFVTRALEAPVLSVKREESTISAVIDLDEEPLSRTTTPTASESFDSQSSAASAAPSVTFSETSVVTTTTTATLPDSSVPESIKSLQRIFVAFKFILASYISSTVAPGLLTLLQDASISGIDFVTLNDHLSHIAKLKAQAAASTDLTSYSRKRSNFEEEEEAEIRAEKKRRLEEEEKRRKAGISHGVKALAKVDVKGMKKMSSFFTPKTKTKG